MMLCKKLVVICCVCWRAHEGNSADHVPEGWRELDVLISEEHLQADDYELSHGYCPTCLEAFLQEYHARQLTSAQSFRHARNAAVQ